MDKKKILEKVRSISMILLGNLLYAAAVKLFLIPTGLVTGGVTGIAIALGKVTGGYVSVYTMILNVVMWVLGLVLLGKQFAFSTLLSTVAYPVFLGILEKVLGDFVLTDDMLLAAVLGGVLVGISLALVMRENSSTGGIDVIPLSLNKYFKVPVSAAMNIIDVIILIAQIAVFPMQNLLYGIIHIMMYSVVLDKLLVAGHSRTELKIISRQYQEISEAIMHEADRGVTLLSAQGGFLHEETQLLLSVISNRQLAKVERMVHEIDPDALVIVTQVAEVSGRGFTLEKKYR